MVSKKSKPSKPNISNNIGAKTKPIKLPKPYLEAWEHAAIQYAPARWRSKGLNIVIEKNLGGIAELWEIFNKDRRKVSSYLKNSHAQAAAYFLGFHLANSARMQMLIERLRSRSLLKKFDFSNTHITDLGSGSGAAHLTLGLYLKEKYDAKLSLRAIDKRRSMQDLAVLMHDKLKIIPESARNFINTSQNLPKIREPDDCTLHIIVLSYLWNELRVKERETLLKNLGRLKKPNLLLVLDPGQEAHAKNLMLTRDHLALMSWRALYPCPDIDACPMIPRGKDWCFSEAIWQLPKQQERIDKLAHLDHTKINTSAFAFTNCEIEARELNIVVGKPRTPKGTSYLLCNKGGITKKPVQGKPKLRGQVL